MDDSLAGRGRPRDLVLDARVGLTLALERIFGCSAHEAARLVAQADPAALDDALVASPIDGDRVLEAISRGVAARPRRDVDAEIAQVEASAARAFPTNESGKRSPDAERRLAARIRKLSAQAATVVRDSHPESSRAEGAATAILQARKTRRARVGHDDAALAEALERALTREDDTILAAHGAAAPTDEEPWPFG